jgi:hypothetical protein
MEELLEVYHRPYDPEIPQVCMDEQPVQLIQEKVIPRPPQAGQPERIDHEYVRQGTASIFLFTEPLAGWRSVRVREQRTALDWAEEIKHLLDEDYPAAKKVCLVCDNLNTHGIASLYKAFEPQEARRLAQRLDIHYTPKHGSWLNIAECELSVLTRQCLDRRIPAMEALSQQTHAWEWERNLKQRGVDWRFTTEDARIKLKQLYPQIKLD